jgi:hypothetical protein
MRRAALVGFAVTATATAAAALAGPAALALAKKKVARTPVRIKAPSPANATVAGFKLSLVRARKASVSLALARTSAALPKNVTVYSVLAKQTRSDRVSGAFVVVNRADAVAARAPAHAAARTITVNIRHDPVPKGYKLTLKLKQSANVLDSHHVFLCSRYFHQSDLGNAQKLAGPRLPNITTGTVIQSACSSARSRNPYPSEGEFRYALNARAGAMVFTGSAQSANDVDGKVSFNYAVQAFGVLADSGHQFTNCAFAGGMCAISSTPGHTNDYALFTISGSPAPRGTELPFALTIAPQVTPALPFQFFGMNAGGSRFGPLLTSGP